MKSTIEISIPVLETHASRGAEDLIFPHDRTAIHSGKLGDIVYALPTVRALGINHLILNVSLPPDEPLRWMDAGAARQLVPLLLNQTYIKRVSLSECHLPLEHAWGGISGVEFNFDLFRNVARHLIGPPPQGLAPTIARFSPDRHPVHLVQIFGASQGARVEGTDPWLTVPKSAEAEGTVVVSVTRNWRTYPDHYWRDLLDGLPRARFVGGPGERERAGLSHLPELAAKDHLQLASHIAGADLFLGTVSFPYSLAEGLKTPRAVEICHGTLNAFPLGKNGSVLPPSVLMARELVARLLGLERHSDYRARTRDLMTRPSIWWKATSLPLRVYSPWAFAGLLRLARSAARHARGTAHALLAAAARAPRIARLSSSR